METSPSLSEIKINGCLFLSFFFYSDATLKNMDWIKKAENASGQATIEHLSETGIFNLHSCTLWLVILYFVNRFC